MINTKVLGSLSAAGLILILSTNCASKTIYILKSPPAEKVKVIVTPAPWPNAVWVKGYWSWRGARYFWLDGCWKKPRRGYVWVQGHWANRPRGWIWAAGH